MTLTATDTAGNVVVLDTFTAAQYQQAQAGTRTTTASLVLWQAVAYTFQFRWTFATTPTCYDNAKAPTCCGATANDIGVGALSCKSFVPG